MLIRNEYTLNVKSVPLVFGILYISNSLQLSVCALHVGSLPSASCSSFTEFTVSEVLLWIDEYLDGGNARSSTNTYEKENVQVRIPTLREVRKLRTKAINWVITKNHLCVSQSQQQEEYDNLIYEQ